MGVGGMVILGRRACAVSDGKPAAYREMEELAPSGHCKPPQPLFPFQCPASVTDPTLCMFSGVL